MGEDGPLMHQLIVYCPHFNFWTSFGFLSPDEKNAIKCFCLDQPNLPHFSNESKGDIRKLTSSILLAYLKDPKKKQGSHSYGSPFQNLTDYFGQMFLQQSGDYLYQKNTSYPVFMEKIPTISVVDNETGNTAISVRKGCSSIYIPMVPQKRATKVSPIGPPKFIMLKKYQ